MAIDAVQPELPAVAHRRHRCRSCLLSGSGSRPRASQQDCARFGFCGRAYRGDLLVCFWFASPSALRRVHGIKAKHALTAVRWRTAVAQFASATARTSVTTASIGFDCLTPEQAADVLHVHVQTIRDYIRSARLPAFRLAGERAIRIRRSDLEALLELPSGSLHIRT